ncbi:MAG TPA: oligosaccharide flippase family protein [Nonomuraea sp.]|nr:oligosaccharide flippase family protein [Nonomuraea sp.]
MSEAARTPPTGMPSPIVGPADATAITATTMGSLILQIVLRLRGLLVVPLYARLLEAGELGLVHVGAAVAALAAPLLHLGLPAGMLIELPHREDGPAVARAYGSGTRVLSGLALLGVVAVALLLPHFPGDALASTWPLQLAVGLVVAGLILRDPSQLVFQLRRRVAEMAALNVWVDYGGAALGVAFAAAGGGAAGLLAGLGGAAVAGSVIGMRRSQALLGPAGRFDAPFVKAAWAVGFPLFLITTAQTVVFTFDRFLIAHHLGAATVAGYGLGYSVASAVTVLAATVNVVFVPVAVGLLQVEGGALRLLVERGLRLLVLLCGLATAGAALLGSPVMAVIAGRPYAHVGVVLPLMVVVYSLMTLVQTLQWVPMVATRRALTPVRAYLAGAVLHVVLTVVLVPRAGVVGALVAALIAFAVALVLMSRAAHAAAPGWSWRPVLPAAALAVLASGAGAAVRLGPDAGPLTVLGAGVTLVAAYGMAALACGALAPRDIALVAASLRR